MTDPPGALMELPPSCKLVHRVLREEGPMTFKSVVEESTLSRRTARYALRRLDEAGLIERRPCPRDARQSIFSVN